MHHLSAASRRRVRLATAVATGTLLASMIAGCSSNDVSDESGEAVGLASTCSDVDLSAVETAATELDGAVETLWAAEGDEAAFATSTVAFLEKGSVLFSSLAVALDPLFEELARTSGQSDIADVTNDFTTAEATFSAIASEISAAGKVSADDIVAIQDVGNGFDDFFQVVNSGSPTGDELAGIPACETMIRQLDLVTTNISAADGQDELNGAD